MHRQDRSVTEVAADVTAALGLYQVRLTAAASDPDKHKMLMEQINKVTPNL